MVNAQAAKMAAKHLFCVTTWLYLYGEIMATYLSTVTLHRLYVDAIRVCMVMKSLVKQRIWVFDVMFNTARAIHSGTATRPTRKSAKLIEQMKKFVGV